MTQCAVHFPQPAHWVILQHPSVDIDAHSSSHQLSQRPPKISHAAVSLVSSASHRVSSILETSRVPKPQQVCATAKRKQLSERKLASLLCMEGLLPETLELNTPDGLFPTIRKSWKCEQDCPLPPEPRQVIVTL